MGMPKSKHKTATKRRAMGACLLSDSDSNSDGELELDLELERETKPPKKKRQKRTERAQIRPSKQSKITDILRRPPPSASSSSWQCEVCTFQNQNIKANAPKCAMCGTPKQHSEHEDIDAADDLDLSQMIGNLSIVQSPLPELR